MSNESKNKVEIFGKGKTGKSSLAWTVCDIIKSAILQSNTDWVHVDCYEEIRNKDKENEHTITVCIFHNLKLNIFIVILIDGDWIDIIVCLFCNAMRIIHRYCNNNNITFDVNSIKLVATNKYSNNDYDAKEYRSQTIESFLDGKPAQLFNANTIKRMNDEELKEFMDDKTKAGDKRLEKFREKTKKLNGGIPLNIYDNPHVDDLIRIEHFQQYVGEMLEMLGLMKDGKLL